MKKMYHFLGSLPFALFLISATALFVIAGTFLESASGSHRFAAQFTYSSPLFAILLSGFFINILFAALRRWPFKTRHIPFLITHLGLLMVIGGTIIKHYYGIQGTMRISEGSGSDEIMLSDTEAILVESKDPPKQALYPLRKSLTGQRRLLTAKDSPLTLSLRGYIPHAIESREIWKTDSEGHLKREKLGSHDGQMLIVYDRGFGGYAVQIPETLDTKELEKQKLAHLKAQLLQAKDVSPPLSFLQQACQKTGVDFPDTFATFLDTWNRSQDWLLVDIPPSIQIPFSQLNWSDLPSHDLQGCLWVSALERALRPRLRQGDNLLELLKEHDWPFLDQLSKANTDDPEALLKLLVQQIFAVAEDLPLLPADDISPARLYSAYLRAYSLHLKDIPFEPVPAHVERPMTVSFEPSPPTKKLEDNHPVVLLQACLNHSFCNFSLGFDPAGTGLKWPLFEGSLRARFQPETHKLPYRIRLRQARQITYAGASQPYSFECDLIIGSMEKTLSMNNVHETADGYRFYLSHIAPPQEGALKTIQLAVNYDPAKYWLTYPGGAILACGIALLFFFSGRKK